RIIQQAALVVDEHGSRGAAASAAGEPGEILEEFKVNRPFVVLIRDTKRNLILFAAAVVKL
ncbi:MAG: serpin family protein, partial [Victivallaceae bacterium]